MQISNYHSHYCIDHCLTIWIRKLELDLQLRWEKQAFHLDKSPLSSVILLWYALAVFMHHSSIVGTNQWLPSHWLHCFDFCQTFFALQDKPNSRDMRIMAIRHSSSFDFRLSTSDFGLQALVCDNSYWLLCKHRAYRWCVREIWNWGRWMNERPNQIYIIAFLVLYISYEPASWVAKLCSNSTVATKWQDIVIWVQNSDIVEMLLACKV